MHSRNEFVFVCLNSFLEVIIDALKTGKLSVISNQVLREKIASPYIYLYILTIAIALHIAHTLTLALLI